MSRTVSIVLVVVVIVVVGAGAFYGGMRYGQQTALSNLQTSFQRGSGQFTFGGGTPGAAPQDGQNGQRGAFVGTGAAGGGTFGTIDSIDGNTMVISSSNGQKTTVQVTDTTLIEKNASVTIAELSQGETVIVSGSKNDDGSVTARSVQVAPAGRISGDSTGTTSGN